MELRRVVCSALVVPRFGRAEFGESACGWMCLEAPVMVAWGALMPLRSGDVVATSLRVGATVKEVYPVLGRCELDGMGLVRIRASGVGVVVRVESWRSVDVARLSPAGSVEFWTVAVVKTGGVSAVLSEALLLLHLLLMLLALLLVLLMPLVVWREEGYRAATVTEVATCGATVCVYVGC